MVFTLHRYIFREVLKVFCLATVALTLMMSLGSILRPVQEYGVGPRQVIDLMGYFLPITLTFVLPMAALFATTLVYGRLANDNELDACRASGISLLPLVYPGLLLALIVATANLLLSFYVMPAFVHRAEKSLKADARQILFRNVQRRGFYALPPDGRYRLYADNADIRSNTLSGVVTAEVGDDGGIKKIITAETAKVAFNPHDKFNEVRIIAHNTHQISPNEDAGFAAEWLSLTTEFGSLLGDNIGFKKIDEMKKIRLDPMLFDPVAKLARRVYAQFIMELLAQQANAAFDSKSNRIFQLHSDRQVVELTAGACTVHDEKQLELADNVVITERQLQDNRPNRTLRCQKAFLDLEGDELAPTLTLDIRNAKWTSAIPLESQANEEQENLQTRYVIRGLILPTAVTDHFKTDNILNEVAPKTISAALHAGPSDNLSKLQKQLQRKIALTLAAIKAETHSRLVFGIGCITLIMIGIGLGIILKGGHLLTAFAASAIPALVLVTCIMMGKNITENPNTTALSGIGLMWTGLIVLSAMVLPMYRWLLRH
ncbi:MAG: LptF/LptG family permease [Sedimentisphaerales bacterium]|jgi:lipopolysaccharide export LptBFGC system permease protein LptF